MTISSISTKRLNLRLLQEDDLHYLLELDQSPDVRKFFPEGILNNKQTQSRMEVFLSFYKEHGLPGFIIFSKESGEFIGRCGFGLIETGEIEVGYLLHRKFWNQGYATETLTALLEWAKSNIDIKYIIAFAPMEHKASYRVMQKCGMEYYKTDTDIKRNIVCQYYRIKNR